MKSFFTLSLSLLAASVAGSAFAETATAKWALGTATFKDIPAEVTPEDAFSATNVTFTGTIGTEKKRTAKPASGDIPMTGYNAVMSATVDKDSYVEFSMNVAKPITVTNVSWDWASIKHTSGLVDVELVIDGNAVSVTNAQKPARTNEDATFDADKDYHFAKDVEVAEAAQSVALRFYLYGDATKARTFGLANVTVTGNLAEGGDTPVDPGFGEAALAAPLAWPANGVKMLPLNGYFQLTYEAPVTIAGKADLNGTALDMEAGNEQGTVVRIPYTGLTAATEYTLTIPARSIGNAEGANEALTYTFTTEPVNTLFYSDFSNLPYGYYELYGLPFITDNVNILAKGSTNKTATAGGMTFFSGTSGRVVALKGNNNSTDLEADYGPNTEADLGASDRSVQLIDGGNGLYVEFPEVEGPADVTFYIANAKVAAGTIVLTDENGDTKAPLTTFELPAAKKMSKYTYTYPYKGTVKLRLYNMKNQININDILVVKGEGEGIDKPVIVDEEAPVLVKSWPSDAPYAPVEGAIVLEYNEPIFAATKATVNGVETDIVVDGNKATIAYAGLENGKAYTVNIPAVADEAGNATEPFEMTINTEAADVLFYTDYNFFPYSYWTKYNMYPADGADNGDIFAKNTSDKTVEIGGLTYVVGATPGRVVAMGKSNLVDDPDNVGGSQRCAQISGGGNALYIEFPEVLGPCKFTAIIGNSTAKAFSFTLVNAADSDTPVATFDTTADKKMFKFEHTVAVETPVKFRLYNNGNQFNIHDLLLTKAEKGGTVGVADVAADAEAPAVYYNLQGVRVENPAEGLYIRVRGNKVEKVLVK